MEEPKSPLKSRNEAKTDIINIKHEIESLEEKYKLFFNLWIKENKEPSNENWAKKEEIQAELTDLYKKLNKYFDEFKNDPTKIGPSVENHKAELKYIQEKIKWVDLTLSDLNSQARSEFFKNDAIKSDGTQNEDYYKIRENIDPLIKERDKLPGDRTRQSIIMTEEKRIASEVFEGNDYKGLDYDLKKFLSMKWTPRMFQEKLDEARAFLAYCKDKGEKIKIEPSIEAMEKVDKLMGDALYGIDNIYVELAKQGITIRPEDIKPYLEKIKQENEKELDNSEEWDYLKVNKEKLENIELFNLTEYPRFSNMENLDKYEKEKIESSYKDLLRITDTMKRYMDKMDELEQKGIKVTGTQHTFDKLRFEGALFRGDGALKDFNKMQLSMALILDRINTLEKNTNSK